MFRTYVTSLVTLLLVAISSVTAWNINDPQDRSRCQTPSKDPLNGCDRQRTLYVSGAGNTTSHKGNPTFQTVQSGKFSAKMLFEIIADELNSCPCTTSQQW